MAVIAFRDIYRNKKILITGHSGFKGSWLTQWLSDLGANVFALSHPESENIRHWQSLKLGIAEQYNDIADSAQTVKFIKKVNPDIIFHLAAQALVRDSYKNPIETWMTNVIGTGNVLEGARQAPALKAIVVVTTDKCYRNNEWPWGYRETDHLGGHDPYSASKAGSELIAASYRSSFFNNPSSPLLATARAGNVIGGGDWSKDRLIPDLVRAIQSKMPLIIRSPKATRPWQHVLECLSGYLVLGQKLLAGESIAADAWNFGPSDEGNLQVESVLTLLKNHWPDIEWQVDNSNQPHEATLLMLDCAKAKTRLHWKPVWNIEKTTEKTSLWYKEYLASGMPITSTQIGEYMNEAKQKKLEWAT
jgi:CDP-glucose 4,6-dehydratase